MLYGFHGSCRTVARLMDKTVDEVYVLLSEAGVSMALVRETEGLIDPRPVAAGYVRPRRVSAAPWTVPVDTTARRERDRHRRVARDT